MKDANQIKQLVKEKYSQIAEQNNEQSSCCGKKTSCCEPEYTVFSEDYSKLEGYNEDADFGLGCGLPTEYAHIKEGDTVVDLGSGAGNDCFVARAVTGEKGKVIGVDFSESMLKAARKNVNKLGFNNVEFRQGDIENLPLENDSIDVVVSNCVFNLVPNKTKAFKETQRILKTGGHFSISDIVTKGTLSERLREDAALYAGCVSGALPQKEYLQIIKDTGFKDINVQKLRKINLPDDMLTAHLTPDEVAEFKREDRGIFSMNVFAKK